uniref:ZPR1 jelly-roll domain-containing protein n=1 Tax=Chlamydomonas euryale TaxID=1486919 RepID=A0A7R9UZ39_9CHLO|mmetsp:Transcript_10194/g.30766  ORF Transcript_10194/g.30766 Transcript_10194/m.30766 type:complete len:243 (+) Transcript_10194:181-909(+)
MGRPIDPAMFKVDMSHQEMERMLSELEQWYSMAAQEGAEWITAAAAASWLKNDLGYEDDAEFEDALNGSFDDFLKAMPHLETKIDDQDRLVFKIRPDLPMEEWKPVKMSLRVATREDLWNVCFKSQHARVEIPEMEFEISQDGKRHIDSIYNHIAGAIFNLGSQVSSASGMYSNDQREKIGECLDELNRHLDLEKPWTWVLYDPSGTSMFQDMTRVVVEDMEAAVPEAVAAQPPSAGMDMID